MGANQETCRGSVGHPDARAAASYAKDGAKGSDWQMASVFYLNNPLPK